MEKIACCNFTAKRRCWVNLPGGVDIIETMVSFCKARGIQMATFDLSGAVSKATYGVFDQQQQVFVTQTHSDDFEIVCCSGNIVLGQNDHQNGFNIDGKILLADKDGNLSGGKLFSETITYAVEMDLTELIGDPISRAYDQTTGRMRLRFNF